MPSFSRTLELFPSVGKRAIVDEASSVPIRADRNSFVGCDLRETNCQGPGGNSEASGRDTGSGTATSATVLSNS